MLSPGANLKERYRILHKIGGGGFGYVYKAVDEAFGCSVAIKETKERIVSDDQRLDEEQRKALEEKLRRAFEREAKLLRGLNHPSLPRVTDYFSRALFRAEDFKNIAGLVVKLRDARDPLSKYLRGQLSMGVQGHLDEYDDSAPLTESLQSALMGELNLLLKGPSLFDVRRFEQINLAGYIHKWIEQEPEGESRIRLNRSLLEQAYPDEISKSLFEQYLVMDFIEGEDLEALLNKRLRQHQGPFTCKELLPWADKILDALEYLHTRPDAIIHRDIKPSNIKLADNGEIYLLDFGLAKGATGQMATVVDGKLVSSVIGFTRAYAPLEQRLQNKDIRPQSDLYSLGATLYHLLTERIPIEAPFRDEALQRKQGDPLPTAHEVNAAIPLAVSKVISHAMEVRWWDRFDSAKEMRAALERACREIATTQPDEENQPGSQSSPDSKDKISTLLIQPPHEPILQGNIEPTPKPSKSPTRLRSLRRPWLIAALALVLIAGLAISMRSVFPHWFSAKQDIQASQPQENLKPSLSLKKTLDDFVNDRTKHIWSVAFSRDGSMAASASEDGTIILWDTKTWRPKFPPLKGHAGAVYSVAFLPNGKILASGGQDATIRLWDTQAGLPLLNVLRREDNKAVLRLTFSPDGDFLASCNGEHPEDGGEEIRLWSVNNGWKPKILKGQAIGIFAIAFSPLDSNTLASAGRDGQLLLWDISNTGPPAKLKVYNRTLTTIAFSSDSKYLACGSSDTTIKIWLYQPQTKKGTELAPTEPHSSLITSIAFSPDNKTLISASIDTTMRLWDVTAQTPKLLWAGQGEIQASQWSVAFSPDGQTLLTGGDDNVVRVWQYTASR